MTYEEMNQMLDTWKQIKRLADDVVGDIATALEITACPYEENDVDTVKYLLENAEQTIKTIKKVLDK